MKNIIFTIIIIFCVVITGSSIGFTEGKKQIKNPVYVIKTSMGDIDVELFEDEAPKTVANFIGLAEGTIEFKDIKTGNKVKYPFYDGLIFHRVIKDFMIQGGCPLGIGTGGPGYTFTDEIDATALGLDNLNAFDNRKGPHSFLMIRSQQDFERNLTIPIFKAMNIRSQKEFDERKEEFKVRLEKLTIKGAYENIGYVYTEKGSKHAPVRGCLAMANSGPNTNGSQFFINLVDTDWLAGKHTVFGKVVKGMDVLDNIGKVKVGSGSKPVKDVKIISISRKKSP
ncbi:MAG: peptidylprolyl isomerase [Proteobacteria bacterium]|nr:peptidylprolyl isomerase [Pseudomonadota bacterium]